MTQEQWVLLLLLKRQAASGCLLCAVCCCLALPPSALFPDSTSLFPKLVLQPVSSLLVKKESAMGLRSIIPVLITVFNLKGIFHIALVLSNPILCRHPKKPTKNDICKDGKKSPSLPLSKLNVRKVGSFSLNMSFF